jgi:hypothetical protein
MGKQALTMWGDLESQDAIDIMRSQDANRRHRCVAFGLLGEEEDKHELYLYNRRSAAQREGSGPLNIDKRGTNGLPRIPLSLLIAIQ